MSNICPYGQAAGEKGVLRWLKADTCPPAGVVRGWELRRMGSAPGHGEVQEGVHSLCSLLTDGCSHASCAELGEVIFISLGVNLGFSAC